MCRQMAGETEKMTGNYRSPAAICSPTSLLAKTPFARVIH